MLGLMEAQLEQTQTLQLACCWSVRFAGAAETQQRRLANLPKLKCHKKSLLLWLHCSIKPQMPFLLTIVTRDPQAASTTPRHLHKPQHMATLHPWLKESSEKAEACEMLTCLKTFYGTTSSSASGRSLKPIGHLFGFIACKEEPISVPFGPARF